MLAKLRPRSIYDVLAAIGCFVALSTGGAYASHLVVDSSDVVDNSLTGTDVKGKPRTSTAAAVNGSLTTDDIAGQQAHSPAGTPFIDGTLTQWDLKNNSVTGSDVLESSLSKVPSASNADSLNGKTAGQLEGARAYALVDGVECPGSPAFCPILRNKGVAYVARVGTGRYCVGVNGISQAAPDSVAFADTPDRADRLFAKWQLGNLGCVSTEFEVVTRDPDDLPTNALFVIVIP